MILKGIANGVPKDITRIAMKGKQLYDSAHSTAYAAVLDANNMWVNTSTAKSIKIRVEPSTQYTLSIDSPNNSIFRICESDNADITPQSASSAVELTRIVRGTTIKQYTFTTSDYAQCIIFQGSSSLYEQWNSTLMLNIGSTALPYEPYGMQQGWEVRDQQGAILWGADKTLTASAGSISYRGYGLPLKDVEVEGNMAQTGTPTPDSPIWPEACGDFVTTGEHAIPITLNGTTQNIYLDEPLRKIGDYADVLNSDGTVTRRIKDRILTGTESWQTTGDGASKYMRLKVGDFNTAVPSLAVCTHALCVSVTTSTTDFGCNVIDSQTSLASFVAFRLEGYQTLSSFKQFLSEQYSSGTPVCVWYVLATPTTEQVTVPTLTPADGNDTLTVGTTLAPSALSITGHVKARN